MGTGALIFGKQFAECRTLAVPNEEEERQPPWVDFELGTQNIGLIAGLTKAFLIKEQDGLNTTKQEGIKEKIRQELLEASDCNILEWNGPHSPGILSWTSINEQVTAQLQSMARDISWKKFPLPQSPKQTGIRLSWSSATSKKDLESCLNFFKNIR